ncbi:hypothetical protein G6O67_004269 [Ophiocordyceps sinensis]|uniref:Uncharacterized protein n=2 Tax=Ophiocordyceps sinensis TaxID=72228 RepID=A0A8H4LYI8_9HYPO|nr:hypothetical protein OCS_02516 [Ophiocordyceps sinensis CO18]KAF4507808.1 hypothetical protein G6O67_004269 [Ophiocordyceps sinensis]
MHHGPRHLHRPNAPLQSAHEPPRHGRGRRRPLPFPRTEAGRTQDIRLEPVPVGVVGHPAQAPFNLADAPAPLAHQEQRAPAPLDGLSAAEDEAEPASFRHLVGEARAECRGGRQGEVDGYFAMQALFTLELLCATANGPEHADAGSISRRRRQSRDFAALDEGNAKKGGGLLPQTGLCALEPAHDGFGVVGKVLQHHNLDLGVALDLARHGLARHNQHLGDARAVDALLDNLSPGMAGGARHHDLHGTRNPSDLEYVETGWLAKP